MTTPSARMMRPADRAVGTALERPTRPALDVSDLPTVVFGSRHPVWWGTIGFMLVEGITLAICLIAYLYLRRNFDAWPPHGTPMPSLVVPTLSLLVLLAVLIPTRLFDRAGKRLDERGVRLWLWVATAATLVVCVLRFLEFRAVNVRWDSNAYGSAVWMTLITHFTLLIADVFESGTLAMIFTLGRHEPKHFVDATDNAFYTYFMVLVWVVPYLIIYWMPRWV